MRKIFSLLLVFLIFFWGSLFNKNTLAAGGSFGCELKCAAGTCKCITTTTGNTCSSGFIPDPSYCSRFVSAGDCNNARGSCISGETCSPEGTCTAGGCGAKPDLGQRDCRTGLVCCGPAGSGGNGQNEVGCEGDIANGINTAIGCIPINNQNALVGFILKWAIGVGGGIAFILILIAGFQIMTSQGDPKRLQAGQELLTSAIAGILLLIFSVFILRVIGLDILQLGESFGTK